MNYVAAGYGITFVVLTGYTLRVLRRGKAISRALPERQSTRSAQSNQPNEQGRAWQ